MRIWVLVSIGFVIILFGCGGGGGQPTMGGGWQPPVSGGEGSQPPASGGEGGQPPTSGGEGEQPPVSEDTEPPVIRNVQVNPKRLPHFRGGEVTISAEVSDKTGINRVWAKVRKPDGMEEEVLMNLKNSIYQGTIRAGINTRNDGQDDVYKVWVYAEDVKGNRTVVGEPPDGITFTVPAPLKPPDSPNL